MKRQRQQRCYLPGVLSFGLLCAFLFTSASAWAVEVYVSSFGDGKVHKIDSDTGVVTEIASGLGNPEGLAIDSKGILYVGGLFRGVKRIDLVTGARLSDVGTNICGPEGPAIDENGDVYFNTRFNPCDHSGIWRVEGGTATIAELVVPFFSQWGEGMAFLTHGPYKDCLIAVASGGILSGKIVRSCPPDYGPTVNFTTFGHKFNSKPIGLAVNSSGDVFVDFNNTGLVQRFSPEGEFLEHYMPFDPVNGLKRPAFIAFDENDNMYVAEEALNRVVMISPDKVWTVLATGFNKPVGLTLAPPRSQFLADVRVISTLSTDRIALDSTSYSIQPQSISTVDGNTVIEWQFDRLTPGSLKNLSFDVILQDLLPGETRLVSQKVELLYIDANGDQVRRELGSQSVHTLDTSFAVSASTDPLQYNAHEDVIASVTVTNLSEFPASVNAVVTVEDSQGNLVQEISAFPISLDSAVPVNVLSGWKKRMKLTIDPARTNSDLVDFPVLVHLGAASGLTSADTTDLFNELGSNQKKIAITRSDGLSQLYVEIESWNEASQEAWLWVKVPYVSSTTETDLYLYYDNAQPDNTSFVGNPGETAAQAVWITEFEAVYHLSQDPTGAAPQMLDSTGHGHNGTVNGTLTASGPVEGAIGPSLVFDGVDDYIDIGSMGPFGGQVNSATVSLWVKTNDTTTTTAILKVINDVANFPSHADPVYAIEANRKLVSGCTLGYSPGATLFYINGRARVFARYITTNIYDGLWHQIVWKITNASSNKMQVYVDGVLQPLVTTGCSVSPRQFAGWRDHLFVGAANNRGTPEGFFNGSIDEVRFSGISPSVDWIKTSYDSQRDGLVSYGPPQSLVPGNSIQTFTFTWNTGTTLAGDYRVRATLYEAGIAVASDTAGFSISSDTGLDSSLTADKIQYSANETVILESTVANIGTNSTISGVNADVTIIDSLSTTVFSVSRSLQDLLPGSGTSIKSFWNTETNAAGDYTAQLNVTSTGGLSSISTTTFTIISSLEQAQSLTGTISVAPGTIIEGEVTALSYTLQNIGNEIDIPDVTIEILVVDPDTGLVHRTLTDFASLNDREVFANGFIFNSSGLTPATYLMVERGIIGEAVQTLSSTVLMIDPVPNSAPTADAGDDIIGSAGQPAPLDGTASSDLEGDPLLYTWSFVSVPEGSALTDADLVGSDTATPSFVPDVVGTYTVSLVVSDGILSSQTDTVFVFVSPPLEIDLHPETISLKSKGGSKSVTVVLFSPLLSGFESLTDLDGLTVTAAFDVSHSYVDLGGNPVSFTTPVTDYPGDDFVQEVDLDGDGLLDGYQIVIKVDRQGIIDGFTDGNGDLRIADPTEVTSTVFGNDIQLGSDTNTVISPSKK